MKTFLFFGLTVFVCLTNALAQAEDRNYQQVIAQRADKIVAALGLTDSTQFKRVSQAVAQQYHDLNHLYEQHKTTKKGITEPDKIKELEAETNRQLGQLHLQYLAQLSKELSSVQIEKIKDGMTYGVLPNTYRAYQEMLPDLTEVQKAQILAYLTEAREHAMDAESSEKKHAWFGKYKGKINNYLSAQGIDMKKESQEWEKRIKEAQAAKK